MSATRISLLLIGMSALYACAGPVGEPPVKDGDSSGSLDSDEDQLTSGATGGLAGSAGSVGSVGSAASSGSGTSSSTTGAGTSGATTGGTSGASSAVSAVSSGGGDFCDNSGDCNSCGACAEQGMCAGPLNACFSDQDCSSLLDCLQGCPDDQCAFDCFNQFPGAEQPYTELADCVLCGACPNDCGGQGC